MAMCEDYPCCGHTDGLGCDYKPDYEHIHAHVSCDHEAGDCWLNETPNSDDWCHACGERMNYSNGKEGVDFVWFYRLLEDWEGNFVGVKYDCSHWACVPEGAALDLSWED